MIRARVLLAFLLATTATAVAAEGGPIRTGEHSDFSRIVMAVAPSTEWSLETAPGRATLHFPGRDLAFGTDGIWDRMPRTRVTGISASRSANGTEVRVDLGCECRVSTVFVDGRYLALDVHDRAASDAGELSGRQAATLAAAESLLMAQIERAADQGLVDLEPVALAGPAGAINEVAPAQAHGENAAIPRELHAAAPPPPPRSIQHADAQAAGEDATALLAHLGLSSQLAAMTVFDRDGPADRASLEPDPACRPDEGFDLTRWSDGRPVPDQIADLRRVIVGEFDRPDPEAIMRLARLHIRHGLGAEAAAILEGFETAIVDRDLLADLARLVEGRSAEGPLSQDVACPGRHGLWLALAGRPAMLAAAEHFPSLRTAFEELPNDLRAMLGPDLVSRFLEAGRVAEARTLHDVAVRPGGAPDAPTQLAAGRLAVAEARLQDAEDQFARLVERNAPNATEALLALVRTRLATGDAVPEDWITDLRSVAIEHRYGPRETEARLLTAEALARNGDIRGAFAGLAALAAERPETRESVESLAPRLLAEADPDRTGRAAFAETALGRAELITQAPANDGYRTAVAAKLLDLGLANAALGILQPAVMRAGEAASLIAARAYVALGDGGAALTHLEDLGGDQAARLRARAQAAQGDFIAATAASAEAGTEAEVLSYAWAGGDWDRAAASPDPARAAMAHYMRDRDAGPAGALPEPVSPEAAFAARSPGLEEPSLAATRSLIDSGRGVQTFVEALLDQPG